MFSLLANVTKFVHLVKKLLDEPCEIIKVVHDDSNEEIEHEKGAEEHKGHEEREGDVGTTGFTGFKHFS